MFTTKVMYEVNYTRKGTKVRKKSKVVLRLIN
jgi:hypothetical protein